MTTERYWTSTSKLDDLFVKELAERLDLCCDELGIAGCRKCPCTVDCQVLWREIEDKTRTLNITEFRQYGQRFYTIREKRNTLLQNRRVRK